MQQNWEELLQQSEKLAARESQGFPRVERDIVQVEEFSKKLKSKSRTVDSAAASLAATRLLSQRGLDTGRLGRDIEVLDIRPSYDDLFQVEVSSVEDYLKRVQETTIAAAIQEAHLDTTAAFEEFMTESLNRNWRSEKDNLFNSVMPLEGFTRGSDGGGTAGSNLQSTGLAVTGRAAKYAQVVQHLNAATVSRQPFDAIGAFSAAAASTPGGEQRASITNLWQLLQFVVGSTGHGTQFGWQPSRLHGARDYLERGHAAYVQNQIYANRLQASLGGNPSRMSQIHAFLRIKEADKGPLDFDQPGGMDTSWERLYFCLRSGYYEEAMQVAKAVKFGAGTRLSATTFESTLQDWLNTGLEDANKRNALGQECERLLKERGRQPGNIYKLLLHVILSGDRRWVELFMQDMGSLVGTIEDFLWFLLTSVHSLKAHPSAAGGFNGGEPYTLLDVQRYLNRFPDTHYSHGGKEPLLYAMVLMLSLQFGSALAYLAENQACKAYRLDIVHLGIAAVQHGLLLRGETEHEEDGRAGAASTAALTASYAHDLIGRDLQLAVDYTWLACEARGGDDGMRTRGVMMAALLCESRAWGFMLGPAETAGGGGALARLVPDGGERRQLLEEMAGACQERGDADYAGELFMLAERPRQALQILNRQAAYLIGPSLDDASRAGELEELLERGNAAISAVGPSLSAQDTYEAEAFETLKNIIALLRAERRTEYGRVLQLLPALKFLPMREVQVRDYVQQSAALHPAVAEQLPGVLLAAAQALAETKQLGELRTLVSFASAMVARIPQAVYHRLNQQYARVCLAA